MMNKRIASVVAATLILTNIPSAFAQTQAPLEERSMLNWPLPETVTPQAKAAVEAVMKTPMPDPLPPIAVIRQFSDSVQTTLGGQLEQRYKVKIEQSTIAGVPVRIIYPNGVTSLDKGPVLLNLHGGGFAVDSGSLTETIPIAAKTGIPVVAALYRLAPEHPFPAAVDDAQAVYDALQKGRKPSQIAVYGTSAGAALSGQLMTRLIRLGKTLPAALGYFSGNADASKRGDSESWMPVPDSSWLQNYAGKTALSDPGLSPIYGDISKFPPTLLLSSTRDFLLSPTSIFARALHEKGVDARLVVFDGLPHAFWAYLDAPEAEQANDIIAQFLKSKLVKK
jgi:epsilon-lactone hydrolase